FRLRNQQRLLEAYSWRPALPGTRQFSARLRSAARARSVAPQRAPPCPSASLYLAVLSWRPCTTVEMASGSAALRPLGGTREHRPQPIYRAPPTEARFSNTSANRPGRRRFLLRRSDG